MDRRLDLAAQRLAHRTDDPLLLIERVLDMKRGDIADVLLRARARAILNAA